MNDNFKTKVADNNSTDNTEEESDAAKSHPFRRIQDGITSKNPTRKMNLDRRWPNSERRGNGRTSYKGASRRYTIDRRLVSKDRRKTEDDIFSG